jgi:hypothetical protein
MSFLYDGRTFFNNNRISIIVLRQSKTCPVLAVHVKSSRRFFEYEERVL